MKPGLPASQAISTAWLSILLAALHSSAIRSAPVEHEIYPMPKNSESAQFFLNSWSVNSHGCASDPPIIFPASADLASLFVPQVRASTKWAAQEKLLQRPLPRLPPYLPCRRDRESLDRLPQASSLRHGRFLSQLPPLLNAPASLHLSKSEQWDSQCFFPQ